MSDSQRHILTYWTDGAFPSCKNELSVILSPFIGVNSASSVAKFSFLAVMVLAITVSLRGAPSEVHAMSPLLSQQFFNIASKGMFSWVVLTDCYISNKYGQSVQSFFCAPITELCRVMSSFSAACSVSDTLTRFAKS